MIAMIDQPRQLPSAIHTHQLITGQPGGISGVLYDMLERGGLIAMGLFLAGEREELVKKSLITSAVIETAVILWQLQERYMPK